MALQGLALCTRQIAKWFDEDPPIDASLPSNTMLCSGNPPKWAAGHTCQKDSGGPLVHWRPDGGAELIGRPWCGSAQAAGAQWSPMP